MKIEIGNLIEKISQYENFDLVLEQEQKIKTKIYVNSPNGKTPITHVIKKKTSGIKIYFQNETMLHCAENHILYKDGKEIYAKELKIGDIVDGNDLFIVENIITSNNEIYYDISVPYPHMYYDSNGILHHNTIISACMSILGEQYGNTLIIVPSRDLVKQTLQDYELLGLDVGVYYGSSKDTTKKHTICTWQSLESWNKDVICKKTGSDINDFANKLSTIIVDEAHSAKAAVLQKLLSGTFRNVPIRWGISGTIPKDQSVFYGLLSVLGPIVTEVKARDLMDKGILSNCNINMIQMLDTVEYPSYTDELKFLTSDKYRLDWMSEFIKETAKTGNTVVLFSRIETGEELHDRIPESHLVYGNIKSEDRERAYSIINDSDNNIVLASFGVASTGINIPRIFNLILIEPGKSFVRVIQSVGRGIRTAKDKNEVDIYDVSSTCKFSKKHFTSRKKLYEDAEYPYTTQKVDYMDDLTTGKLSVKYRI